MRAYLRTLGSRVWSLFRRRRIEAEMAEEMRQHLEDLTKVNLADGMTPEEARFAAQRRFGGMAQIQERCRDERGFVWLDQFFNNIRFTVRSLRRTPGFTLTVLLTLILGIGVTTVVFNLTAGILIYASPFPKVEQLFCFGFKDKQNAAVYWTSGFQFQDDQEQTNVFTELAALESVTANVVVDGEPAAASVANVSADYFHTFGIIPALGRGFRPEEYRIGTNNVIVITDLFWRQHFNASPDVLGRRVLIDQQLCTVIGVLSADQAFPSAFPTDFRPAVYRPLVYKLDPANIFAPNLVVVGRVKPGVSRDQALAALSAVRAKVTLPQWAVDWYAGEKPILTSLTEINRPEIYWVILIAAAFLYAIACLNTMNLMLIRLWGRRRELSIRFAVGGTRGQVIQLLVLESAGLALVASLVVFMAARWIFPSLFVLLTGSEVALYHNYWNWRTLSCIAGLSVFASLAAVLTPAARLLRAQINSGLKEGGPTMGENRSAGRVRNLLVIFQAAFAVILLTGTGLMVRSFERLHHLNLGFDPAGKVKVYIALPNDYQLKPEARLQLFERLRQRVSAIPGVKSASSSQDSLLVGVFAGTAQLQMADGTFQPVAGNFVSHDFQQTAGLVMKEGRWLSGKRGIFEAVINEAFAKARFGNRDPVGLSFKIKVSGDHPLPIVGVVQDVRETVRSSPGIRFYVPDWAYPPNINTLLLKLDHDPKREFAGLVRRAIYEIDPRLIVVNVQSIDELVGEEMAAEQFAFTVLKGLAAIALGLTVVGLFSVITYSVDRRMREFGVRIALGAKPSDLHRLVMLRGLAAAAFGLTIGTAAALGLTRFMESLLFETKPYDTLVYVGVAGILLAAGAVACWLPARRAARVDVVTLLRED